MPVQRGRSDVFDRPEPIGTAGAWRTFSDDDQTFAGVSAVRSRHGERCDVPRRTMGEASSVVASMSCG
jgi:hypothetical protein